MAAAAAFAIVVLDGLADLKSTNEAALAPAMSQMRSVLDSNEITGSTDRHKQEVYEGLMGAVGVTLIVAQLAEDTPESAKNLQRLASGYLQAIVGVDASRIDVSARGITIRGLPPQEVKAVEAKPAQANGLAPGFSFSLPKGFEQKENWYSAEMKVDSGIGGVHIRFWPAIPAQGDINQALLQMSQMMTPPMDSQNATMIYRRRVGNGLLASYRVIRGKERGRRPETQFTLMLIDCGSHWQPVITAQTFRSPDDVPATWQSVDENQAYMRWPEVLPALEGFLSTFRCPGHENKPMLTQKDVVGSFSYGTGSSTGWINTFTGATFNTVVAYAVFYDFKANGTYDYRFQGATGVGVGTITTDRDSGRWRIEGDFLVTEGNKWKTSHRVGAVFSQGTNKVLGLGDGIGNGPMNVELASRLDIYTSR
ncbi:MAG: hypothetical protein MUC92_11055 [Fimbriimonadaceae bacterium]|nr:hypothetical protein [Fimbriimonadaceae bacterium]